MNDNSEHSFEWQGAVMLLLLRDVAKQKGLTHDEIAMRTGMTKGNVSRILTAKYQPSLANFLKLAHAIGINFFFEDKEDKSDLNKAMEEAMEYLGRRPPKNLN